MNDDRRLAKTIMIQGTGSSVGKSVIVAALSRILKQEGYRVAPFKAQNMSLNSFVTRENGEISRAQAVQAEAAGVEPSVHMNPVLLKPSANNKAQVVLLGKHQVLLTAAEYQNCKKRFWKYIVASLHQLQQKYQVVVLEGAGSPAEINIPHDLANMSVAEEAHSPVLLVGDIDKGGVFASLIGTWGLLGQEQRSLIGGFIINKFRGDEAILRPGLDFLEERTGIPVVGVIPYSSSLALPEEDSHSHWQGLQEEEVESAGPVEIAVIHLPHLANFTDFETLKREPLVRLRYVVNPREAGHADALIIPGSKSTLEDLAFLRSTGWVAKIGELLQAGTLIVGICGGFQMMGTTIKDPEGIESDLREAGGLGLLDTATVFSLPKATYQVEARGFGDWPEVGIDSSRVLRGYEIHMGKTVYGNGTQPAFLITRRGEKRVWVRDGAINIERGILGTYIHNIFENDGFRYSFIARLAARKGVNIDSIEKGKWQTSSRNSMLDELAKLVRNSLDMEYVFKVIGLRNPATVALKSLD